MLHFIQKRDGFIAEPLDAVELLVEPGNGARISVTDGAGNDYFGAAAKGKILFLVGGAVGTHRVRLLDAGGKVLAERTFNVAAQTRIEDEKGEFSDLLQVLHRTMLCYNPTGSGDIVWRGKSYSYYVPWILDHVHTARGMQYFSAAARGLVDLLTQIQREDGMIWSQVEVDGGWPDFFDTRDGNKNFYTRRDGGIRMMRQPAENHCEYNFVDSVHLVWKSGGDDVWMKEHLDSVCRALDYTRNSRARWSERFGLLKRGYTVDSWDFQIDDEYSVHFPTGTDMCIDEEKTKFGVFFGDNTGYARACDQAGEMLEHAGRAEEAAKYRERGREIRQRLDKVSWNGRFFQHRVEEDPAVKRNLGVDEKAQIAMSNAYSLNRDIPREQAVSILKTYGDLKEHLPPGSPGEWYAIYPPFGRGFGDHNGKWQYMNGGVHGHAAGELARGAFAHGYERYGADILQRLRQLGHAHGGILHFAYTGAYETPPPSQKFSTVDLRPAANMDLRSDGSPAVTPWMLEGPGNDIRNLPTGHQTFEGVPYQITDPAKNERKAALGVSTRKGLPETAELPVGQRGAALYFLHTAGPAASGIGASVTLRYEDGTEHTQYLVAGKHFTGWWFPELAVQNAGIAWRGPNEKSACVGLSWACVENPHPDKLIKTILFGAARDGGIYALVGVTLADRMPYHRPDPVSYGGPDNWAGGTTMAALIEGLAGVQDQEGTAAFQQIVLSPRWAAADVNQVKATLTYPASSGYVSYVYAHNPEAKTIQLTLTGSGQGAKLRLLLPGRAKAISSSTIDGKPIPAQLERIEESLYATLPLESLQIPHEIQVAYS